MTCISNLDCFHERNWVLKRDAKSFRLSAPSQICLTVCSCSSCIRYHSNCRGRSGISKNYLSLRSKHVVGSTNLCCFFSPATLSVLYPVQEVWCSWRAAVWNTFLFVCVLFLTPDSSDVLVTLWKTLILLSPFLINIHTAHVK